MKILIIGGSGKIGKFFQRKKNIIFTYYKNKIDGGIYFDLLRDNIDDLLQKYKTNCVVLLSSISDPDDCLKNKKYSNLLNVVKTKLLIDKIISRKIHFIFFSSGFIFNGLIGNYSEKNNSKPVNLYGKQKLNIERYIKKKTNNYTILRIAKTYSDDINDQTLISKFLKSLKDGNKFFKFADDQKFNPLFVKDLNNIINFFIKKKIVGIFNIGGPEQLSRYDCMIKIKNLFGKNSSKIIVNKTKFSTFKVTEKRPLDVTMNIKKFTNIYKKKLKKIDEVAKKMIIKENLYEKIFRDPGMKKL